MRLFVIIHFVIIHGGYSNNKANYYHNHFSSGLNSKCQKYIETPKSTEMSENAVEVKWVLSTLFTFCCNSKGLKKGLVF